MGSKRASRTPRVMSRILSGPEAIAAGIAELTAHRPVAFPTETVYGLGADALNEEAVHAVFSLKGRPSTNPLIVHVSGIEMAQPLVEEWTERADAIARAHWPGPVTIVLKKSGCVPGIVCAGGETVAIRCPAHPVALALIEAFGRPIVGPSANPSGWISPTTPEHVLAGFPEKDLVIIDGGACRAGIESTVLDLASGAPRVLRPGVVGRDLLSNTLGVDVEHASLVEDGSPLRSPGLLGAHYQPRTPCRLVKSSDLASAPSAAAVIAWSISSHPSGGVFAGLPGDPEGYASGLYSAMHRADAGPCGEIWIEHPPAGDNAIWDAVLERLARATKSG